ncbi:hypothetical protein JG687_00011163 [Phytophthora cactorum]|uniref:Uncharacterized protein n=1 Tax=Phytophthora cactorum TaxID=29920 RepID=A0A8T1UAE3_9STRA|nr:hypothetical protein PC120_g11065 [Phytophthora cactorum]KAG3074394.1 hypothetical protein PC121_g8360 [Phytophthora cactorum]KAG4053822.1 hypothetical protein PC123_g11038 [Phytophthora cactorum]KAG6955492.1 hypothetical protein JG687_00011163 [Phytophthora cactorum]
MNEYDDYEPADRLELPPAPRSLWDFVDILTPVLKYYVALLALFLGARWFNRQLDNEAAAQEREAQQPRPTLSPELTVESSEEEESDDDEEIEELVTDGDRLVPIGDKQPKKKKPNPTKELFDGLRKVEQELRDKKDKEDADDNVSWNELHSSMLKRYKDKYPNHGPRVADPETDKYDEEFNELLRKNNINPDDLKSQSGKKGE